MFLEKRTVLGVGALYLCSASYTAPCGNQSILVVNSRDDSF